jgi:hypothetical protein
MGNAAAKEACRTDSADDAVVALPTDPEWERLERRMVEHNNQNLPAFEE